MLKLNFPNTLHYFKGKISLIFSERNAIQILVKDRWMQFNGGAIKLIKQTLMNVS
jgi:hypothetical protein